MVPPPPIMITDVVSLGILDKVVFVIRRVLDESE
jgi:hypothetical protein